MAGPKSGFEQMDDLPEPVETSHLTDADWAEVNRIWRAWQIGGKKELNKVLAELAKTDPIRYLHVMHAYFPQMVTDAVKDSMAEKGMTEDDIRELVRKLESP